MRAAGLSEELIIFYRAPGYSLSINKEVHALLRALQYRAVLKTILKKQEPETSLYKHQYQCTSAIAIYLRACQSTTLQTYTEE
jgi:hypothetical protein